MIMHPTLPEINGTILKAKKYNCTLKKYGSQAEQAGENFFIEMVKICKKQGRGFIAYEWPKPIRNGLSRKQPKLSYVKLNKEWNWIIGSGIYIDDAIKQTIKDLKGSIKKNEI